MQAISLLRPVLADRSFTLTNLTPTHATSRLMTRFGFEVLETEALVLSPLFRLATRSLRRCSFPSDPNAIDAAFDGRTREVFRHHRHARCGQPAPRASRRPLVRAQST